MNLRNGIPEDGVRLIHNQDNKLFLNFSTRTFIGYGEVRFSCLVFRYSD